MAARERERAISREEASKTISQLVCGSIVTYSAGLDIPNLVTGFETCTLRVQNLSSNVKEDDIRALLRDHGVGDHQSHFMIKKKSRLVEVLIVTDIAAGRVLATGLDGVEFQDKTLIVEMTATNSLDGMSAATGQRSEILTISWRAPSASYVAEYIDIEAANAKVKELDRFVHGGRRIKVEMNTQPRGRVVPNLRLNAVRINNLLPSITDEDVKSFTNALSVKRLPVRGALTVEEIFKLVQADIEQVVPGGPQKFDDPLSTSTMEGIVSARAHFSSWDDAHAAYARLSDKQYGNQPVWLRLPDPMQFTLVIPVDQYKAQKTQWDSLVSLIKDRKASTLNVRASGNVVTIRLSGSVKGAMGALKVRVENLARGDKVEGWHREFGIPGNSFVLRVHSDTGAYLRPDWKRRSLKLYGVPGTIDRAREMIKHELERLASLDQTITLPRHSVGFFVREGIQQLKETLGENNVRFTTSSRKLTVSGGEEARHALDRLIALSHNASYGRIPNTAQGNQTCPVCYDNVSSPHQLGCGHTYCVACLRHLISSAIESDQLPLACLGDEAQCRAPIAIPTIGRFLPPASFSRLLEAAFDVYIAKHPEEFKHCKTPDCMQIYRAAQPGAVPQTLHCPSCFSAVCNGCHEDAHDGLSCAENKARDPAEQERLNDTWIASQGGRVKKCPQCSVPIEKLEGCNHMTCRYAFFLSSLSSLSKFVYAPGAGRTFVGDAWAYLPPSPFMIICALLTGRSTMMIPLFRWRPPISTLAFQLILKSSENSSDNLKRATLGGFKMLCVWRMK